MAKVVQKEGTKQELLEAGTRLMLEKGYSNCGLQEVLESVGVPKGSFYYYFDSKEEFALQIIRHFDQEYTERILSSLRDESLSPLERLKLYCKKNKQNIEERKCTRGCLIGNLSQEMASQSEVLREELEKVFQRWTDVFAACIEAGQKTGEIRRDFEPLSLADFFLSGWEGAVMRAKSTRTTKPIDIFIEMTFAFMAI
ncbi:TetR/AcrR family transcriptional regulator [soil metagenome]